LPAQHDALETLVLAVGGFDPTGGAGLIRDFVTATALGARVQMYATAFTDQSADGVRGVEARDPDRLRREVEATLAAARPGRVAVKLGMVADAAQVPALLQALAGFAGPVVHDPVLAASRGGSLYRGEPAALQPLLARATLITPNRSEAAVLAGVPVDDLEGARAAAQRLRALGARAVLVKGGHLDGGVAEDLLVSDAGVEVLSAPRVPGKDPRGTGCALATAIAVHLARGLPLTAAVGMAKQWLHERIVAARPDAQGTCWL
jgi:hydroxymethylpyrimidine/phosphomethylpyrimidine kinase